MSAAGASSVYSEKPESELLKLAKNGDDAAFSVIADRYISLIKSIAGGYYADGYDINDLSQEGLIALFAAVRSFKEDSEISFKNYAALCVKRRYISIVRKATAKSVIPAGDIVPIDSALDAADNSTNPEELSVNREYLNYIIDAAEKRLSEKEKKIFSLFVSGKTCSEIAEDIGSSPKSVDNALQRVKKKLSPLKND